MKSIIIGGGSIGIRHFNNLKKLNVDVKVVDIDEIDNIDSILSNTIFNFGLVCTPTNLHLEHTLKLAEYGIDFFCEKPFFAKKDLESINKIRKLINENNLINMVGCNMRFHPAIKSFDYSNVCNINVTFGYDLKKWHNNGKHLKSYSANKIMGGGILLDAIHEFDYIYNWFGGIKEIYGKKQKVGNVTVDTEDVVDAKVLFENGVSANIHLDYLQMKYTRYFEVENKKINIKPNDDMYIEEMKYFIDCVENRKKCMNNINDAVYLIDKINDGIDGY